MAIRDCSGTFLSARAGADHGRLIDDHQSASVQLQCVVTQQLQGFGDRVALVPGPFADRDVDGLAGGREDQDGAVDAAVRRRAQGEVVLPAPAGAVSGWMSQGERPMSSTARF